MRKHARIDANHKQIVSALRKAGCTVQSLATIGHGCPDLLVSRKGHTWLFEVKDGKQPPSNQKLTWEEVAWHARWQGYVAIVRSVDEALTEVGAI